MQYQLTPEDKKLVIDHLTEVTKTAHDPIMRDITFNILRDLGLGDYVTEPQARWINTNFIIHRKPILEALEVAGTNFKKKPEVAVEVPVADKEMTTDELIEVIGTVNKVCQALVDKLRADKSRADKSK